jgi:WhiB family redox-sensing transcriptional regulator
MDRDWVHRSACKGLDPIIFYPATDEEADEAKAVCAECPVQGECLEHAIGHREHNGVWGGATERERQRIIRRRRRLRAMGGTDATGRGDDGAPVIASSAVGR